MKLIFIEILDICNYIVLKGFKTLTNSWINADFMYQDLSNIP